MHVAELWRYPVKSLAGVQVDEVEITASGLAGDREVRIRGLTGRRITARQFPALLGLDGTRPVSELLDEVRAICGDDVELVADPSRTRQDVLPVSVATDGAVAELGIDRRRLRPNVVLGGVEGLAEREWNGRALRVGEAILGVRQVRGRCVMTTIDPDTLEQDLGVLQRIVDEYEGRFALDCYVVAPGRVRAGDEAALLDWWTLPRDEPNRQLGAVRPFAPAG